MRSPFIMMWMFILSTSARADAPMTAPACTHALIENVFLNDAIYLTNATSASVVQSVDTLASDSEDDLVVPNTVEISRMISHSSFLGFHDLAIPMAVWTFPWLSDLLEMFLKNPETST